MSPLNRGPHPGPRILSGGARLPPPRFGIAPPGMRVLPPLMTSAFSGHAAIAMRHRLPPPSRLHGGVPRPNGMLPLFPGGPRARGMAPIVPPMVPHGSGPPPPHGFPVRPWLRRRPPQMPLPPPPPPPPHMSPGSQMPHMRRRFIASDGNVKGKAVNNTKKVNKHEELELKKPWMSDDIRNEIQKKNKLYTKAKKTKDAAEWEEFKDLRNKVTRMIRDAKNEYVAQHPEQARLYPDDENQEEICSDEDIPCHEVVIDRDLILSEDIACDFESMHICGVDGCTYKANFLVVEKHLREQHNKNLLPGNKNVSISFIKWMMERRRKFLEIRKTSEAKELEKLKRGEIIKQVHNVQTRKVTRTREKKYKTRKRRVREIANSPVCTVDTYRGLRPFPGIGRKEEDKLCSEEEMEADLDKKFVISDEDDNVPQVIPSESSINPSINSSIPVLVADYKDETDDDEAPEEMPIERLKTLVSQDDEITKSVVNGETSVQVHEKASDTLQISTSSDLQSTDINTKSNKSSLNANAKCQNKQKNEKKQNCKERKANYNKNEKILHKYRNKFLENLLSRDIQHERNLICQCMKYIVDNNFFDSNENL